MAANALALPIFAITLFVSAFLLFLVQPMIGKMILPSLGGTPQVWNTCMVFFQMALLAGYAYTHTVSTRLKLRSQLMLHGVLLFLPLLLLLLGGPYAERIDSFFAGNPPTGGNPVLMTLFLLAIVVGLPFFVVSTSAPLLQKWFTYTGHPAAKDPYFLYGASNLGSMLALIFYPVFIEPMLGLNDQSWTWAIGYFFLVALFFVCVGMVWKAPPLVQLPATEEKPAEEKPEEAQEEKKETTFTAKKPVGASSFSSKIRKGAKQRGKPAPQSIAPGKPATPSRPFVYEEPRSDVMTPWRRLRWVALAAVPSSLMLGIITYISTDVSAIPLFWVIPLALYLLSFILVFSRWPAVWTRQPHTLMVIGFPIVFVCFLLLLLTGQISPVYRSIAFSILAFFLTAMVCHGELARDRPSPKYLTEFYLWLSVGGMLGGVFNALFAPVLFWGLAELPIALVLACLLRPFTYRLAPVDRPALVGFCAALGLIVGFLLLAQWNAWLGLLLGMGVGALVGSVMNFERERTHGWTENMLLSAFPGLGEWFDEKGKELAAEAQETPAGEVEPEKPKKIIRQKTAPDYYLLNYTMDIALPIVVVLLMLLLTQNSRAVEEFVYNVSTKTFGTPTATADWLATGLGYFFLPYGVPVLFALMFAFRPLRFGLTIAAIFLVTGMREARESPYSTTLAKTRTYFGILKVHMKIDLYRTTQGAAVMDRLSEEEALWLESDEVGAPTPHTYLMHGTTHHGLNFQGPDKLRRLATTYYHRLGPVGWAFQHYDWFKTMENETKSSSKLLENIYRFKSDARMPVTLVAAGATPLGFNPLPTDQIVALWSEPPYATIGLGTGTMASYGRPFQHCTFYEIDETIRDFSLKDFDLVTTLGGEEMNTPARGPYFNYIHDALLRGVNMEVVMGDARLSMKADVEELREEERAKEGFGGTYQIREKYYHAMVVDAFSSDAIPVHLITKEAIKQYFDKLTDDGVLLLHTSNRHVELVDPILDIVKELSREEPGLKGLKYRVGNDRGQGGSMRVWDSRGKKAVSVYWGSKARGHFQSEYVLLAKDEKYLPENSSEAEIAAYNGMYRGELIVDPDDLPYIIWTTPTPPGRPTWTDDYQNLMSVFRWGFRF